MNWFDIDRVNDWTEIASFVLHIAKLERRGPEVWRLNSNKDILTDDTTIDLNLIWGTFEKCFFYLAHFSVTILIRFKFFLWFLILCVYYS